MAGYAVAIASEPVAGGGQRIGASVTMTLSVEIERSSPVPLYFQVAQAFEKAILDGRAQTG